MGIVTLGYKLLSRLDPRIFKSFRSKVSECTFDDPHFAAKFFPYQPRLRSYILPKCTRGNQDVGTNLPIPPQGLWLDYAKTPEEYLINGQRRMDQTREILGTTGLKLEPGNRILDFGCASGIMLRWFLDLAETGEAWGVDIFGPAIVWCQQNLSPPFKFVTTTSFPHLPFEDHYFDFIYAGSVFTHIADLAEAWLVELKRIVRPGGRLLITVHDNETIRCLVDEHVDPALYELVRSFDEETRFRTTGFSMFSINRTPGGGASGQAQVFYDLEYLRQHWGNYLKVITTVPRVWGGKQTAVILEK
jgi:SAM-dependent methyltransferase